MERFVKGDVVVVSFPFTDLSTSKRRTALVLSNIQSEDLLLGRIISQDLRDPFSIPLSPSDFFSALYRKQAIFGLTEFLQQVKKLFYTKQVQLIPQRIQK